MVVYEAFFNYGKEGLENNIDIYMHPLIHELKFLWKGVNDFDSYTNVNSNFKQL